MSFLGIASGCPQPAGEVMSALLPDILKQRIKQDSEDHEVLLIAAIADRNTPFLNWLIVNGTDVKQTPEELLETYNMPLALALVEGNQEAAQSIVQAGIPLSAVALSASEISDAKDLAQGGYSPGTQQGMMELPMLATVYKRLTSSFAKLPLPQVSYNALELARFSGNQQLINWVAQGGVIQQQPSMGLGALLGGSPQLYQGSPGLRVQPGLTGLSPRIGTSITGLPPTSPRGSVVSLGGLPGAEFPTQQQLGNLALATPSSVTGIPGSATQQAPTGSILGLLGTQVPALTEDQIRQFIRTSDATTVGSEILQDEKKFPRDILAKIVPQSIGAIRNNDRTFQLLQERYGNVDEFTRRVAFNLMNQQGAPVPPIWVRRFLSPDVAENMLSRMPESTAAFTQLATNIGQIIKKEENAFQSAPGSGILGFAALVKSVAQTTPNDIALGQRVLEDEKAFPLEVLALGNPVLANLIDQSRKEGKNFIDISRQLQQNISQLPPSQREIIRGRLASQIAPMIKNLNRINPDIIDALLPGQQQAFSTQISAYNEYARAIGAAMREVATRAP